jgi:hypothetical protein
MFLDTDTNVTMDRHVALIASRGVEEELCGETSWKTKKEGEELYS